MGSVLSVASNSYDFYHLPSLCDDSFPTLPDLSSLDDDGDVDCASSCLVGDDQQQWGDSSIMDVEDRSSSSSPSLASFSFSPSSISSSSCLAHEEKRRPVIATVPSSVPVGSSAPRGVVLPPLPAAADDAAVRDPDLVFDLYEATEDSPAVPLAQHAVAHDVPARFVRSSGCFQLDISCVLPDKYAPHSGHHFVLCVRTRRAGVPPPGSGYLVARKGLVPLPELVLRRDNGITYRRRTVNDAVRKARPRYCYVYLDRQENERTCRVPIQLRWARIRRS